MTTPKTMTGPVVFAHGARVYSEGLIEAFQKALKGFDTVHCETAEAVLALFEGPKDKAPIMLVIDDQLEHNGHFSDDETECGTATGTALCKVLRATVNPVLPVVLYTTRQDNFLRMKGYVDPYFVSVRVDLSIVDRVIHAAKELFPFAESMEALVSRP
jgi:hypothetical protein